MASELPQRLAAILAADIAGYTHLMELDEAGVVIAWRRARAEVIDPTVARYQGRIVKLTGDGFLAEFSTVESAVKAALAMQEAFATLFADLPAEHRVAFRMGVNVGDIWVDAEDIYGAGVNVAARLEGLAEPGGICISGSAYDAVKHKITAHYESLGPQTVKNVAAPIEAWRVYRALQIPPHGSPQAQPDAAAARLRRSVFWWTSAALGAVVVATLVALALRPGDQRSAPSPAGTAAQTQSEDADVVPPATPVTPRFRIAVMPFENLSPDPDNAFFAAGLHEEILNQLAKLKALNVIARTTMRQYQNTTKTIPEIARELNVQTVMEGSIRYADDRVRVTTQLIDSVTGVHLWSETYEREFADVFAIESDIAMKVAAALSAEFTAEEEVAMMQPPTDSTEAYALYLAAMAHLERFTGEEILLGIDKIEQALELDSEFVQGWVVKSNLYRRLPGYVPERAEEGRTVGEQAARQAVEIDPDSTAAREGLGAILIELGRWQEAEAEFRKIPAELLRRASGSYAWHRFVTGHPEDSLKGFQRILQNNPLAQEYSAFYISLMDALGDSAGSLDAYQRGAALFDDWVFGRYHAAGTLLGNGDLQGFSDLMSEDTPPVVRTLLDLMDTPETAAAGLRALVESGRYTTIPERDWLAYWAAYLDQPELALELLAPLARELPTTAYVFWRPVYASVRRHPGFKTLVTETGHVDFWREYGWPDLCKPVGANDFECH